MEYILDNTIIFRYLREIEEEYNKVLDYIDMTEKWLNEATPNSHKILERNYYEHDGKIYKINKENKNVVLDYTKEEKECAEWLENTFGGEIYLNPRINVPEHIETADYLWNGELWDRKSIKDATSTKRAVDNAIKNYKSQTNNFILDITGCKLDNDVIIKQVKSVFTHGEFCRNWVRKIIIKRDNNVIKFYIKK